MMRWKGARGVVLETSVGGITRTGQKDLITCRVVHRQIGCGLGSCFINSGIRILLVGLKY